MRNILLESLYERSKKPYQKWVKKSDPWNIPMNELLQYPKTSLGFHLGCFLLKHHFELQPKLEDHDVFHVLTGTGISVPEEISMQYYLLGNGKRSLYLFTVLGLGTLLYPDYLKTFMKAYLRGKNALQFFHLNFKKMLLQPLEQLQNTFLIQ